MGRKKDPEAVGRTSKGEALYKGPPAGSLTSPSGRKGDIVGKLPKFHQIGSDKHPLGKRSIWLHEDGSGEMLSEAHGMRSTVKFSPGQGHQTLAEIKSTYEAHDSGAPGPSLFKRSDHFDHGRTDG